MHIVVKASNLAHMDITPTKVNLAIVPSQISPVGAVAAIFFNGRYVTISQKRRGVEPSLSTLCRFSWAKSSEKVLPNTSCHCIRHCGGHLCKMAAIYKVIRLSQKLRGTEPSISTLCLGFVGVDFRKSIAEYQCHYIHHFGGDLKKRWRPFPK